MQGGASAYSAASALVSAVVASGLPDGVAALRSLDVWTAVAVLSLAPSLQGGRVGTAMAGASEWQAELKFGKYLLADSLRLHLSQCHMHCSRQPWLELRNLCGRHHLRRSRLDSAPQTLFPR